LHQNTFSTVFHPDIAGFYSILMTPSCIPAYSGLQQQLPDILFLSPVLYLKPWIHTKTRFVTVCRKSDHSILNNVTKCDAACRQNFNKNSSGDEIANVLVNDDIAHT